MDHDDYTHLLNAARQPVAAMTAAQVESQARAREVIAQVKAITDSRPVAQLPFVCNVHQHAAALDAARKAISGWTEGEGVLFMVDNTPLDAEDSLSFWRAMNLLREQWASLPCHVIFLLQPRNYALLLAAADHLADWMPLKLDLRQHERRSFEGSQQEMPSSRFGSVTGREARATLDQLESALAEVLAHEQPGEQSLVRRFYLPMLELAIIAGEVARAAAYADRLRDVEVPDADRIRLLQSLAYACIDSYHLEHAQKHAGALLELATEVGDSGAEAEALFQLGRIAQEQRELDISEAWYRKSLEIEERQGNEHRAASTYHQLGLLAHYRRDLDQAETWYRKSLEIRERQGNEHGAAITYHQLGMLAQDRRDLDQAETWYQKSLEIEGRQGNEYEAAGTYHQLGILAQDRRDLDQAEAWYRKSLEIKERQGNEHGAASTYHRLGLLAQDRRDLDQAETWYQKSLEIEERQGNEQGAALTCDGMGDLFLARAQPQEALAWFVRAQRLFAQVGDDHHAAMAARSIAMVLDAHPELNGEVGCAALNTTEPARAHSVEPS